MRLHILRESLLRRQVELDHRVRERLGESSQRRYEPQHSAIESAVDLESQHRSGGYILKNRRRKRRPRSYTKKKEVTYGWAPASTTSRPDNRRRRQARGAKIDGITAYAPDRWAGYTRPRTEYAPTWPTAGRLVWRSRGAPPAAAGRRSRAASRTDPYPED